MELFTDGQAKIDKLGAVFFAGFAPESGFDSFKSRHSPGIAGHEFLKRWIVEGNHVPEGMGEIIRPPPEFIGIIKTVGNQHTLRCPDTNDRLEGFMVFDRPTDVIDFVGLQWVVF